MERVYRSHPSCTLTSCALTLRVGGRRCRPSSYHLVAKSEDVGKIQTTLKTIETGIAQAASAWESGSSEFVATLELQSKRTDNLYKIINSERSSFEEFHRQILAFLGDDTVRQRVIGHTLITLKEFILQISEVDMIYNGILDLLGGKLSHNLLDHHQLNESMQWLQSELDTNNTGLIILRQDPRYYFEQSRFKIWSHNGHLASLSYANRK